MAGVPVDLASIVRPGGDLRNGLRVPRGAYLLGTVRPASCCDGELDLLTQWAATLLLTGDPEAAMRELFDQARAQGFDMRPRAATDLLCGPTQEPWLQQQGEACYAAGSDSTGHFVSLDAVRAAAELPVSRLEVRYLAEAADTLATSVVGRPERHPTPLPRSWSLPRSGELFGDKEDRLELRLQRGTWLVAPAMAAPLGYVAILRVEGDPRTAAAAYTQQPGGVTCPAVVPMTSVRGARIISCSGGGDNLVAFAERDGPTYVWIERSALR